MSPPKTNSDKLTERELTIMHIFWDRGETTVADVHQKLAQQGHDLAYTSVATMVRILEEKGFLEITKAKRPFLYRATRDFKDVSKNLLDDLLQRVFRGSREHLLVQLVEGERLSKKERDAIEKLLRRK